MNQAYNQEELDKIRAAMAQITSTLSQSPSRGNAYKPYYREQYALEIKQTLDAIAASGEPMIIPLGGLKIGTLKLKYYQAAEYLHDHLDPEGFYKELLKNRLNVNHFDKRGIVIRPKKERGILAGMKIKDWRGDFLNYLDTSAPMDKFERVGIPINDEDLNWIKEQMRDIEHMFVCDNNYNGLLIVRIK